MVIYVYSGLVDISVNFKSNFDCGWVSIGWCWWYIYYVFNIGNGIFYWCSNGLFEYFCRCVRVGCGDLYNWWCYFRVLCNW